ncbi:MAG: hypothetical protein IT287_09530 [Bdellovibrionaceae bacterium]|nr:hypothetical protein [Pseudobdellovibrionaceae bacterium]
MKRICLILGLLFFVTGAHAYPEFIGYKYSSCLTCHYNSHGNGPINDYGRALWSAEIAGRLMSGKKTTEEQLSASSGFLGSKELPWWFRPGVKARQLWVQTNPGGENSDDRNITMQADVNAAIFFDKDQKYAFVGSIGYVPEPFRLRNSGEKVDTFISREHYFRWQAKEELWMYFGMMDKVYGIRNVDHTAFSRSATGLAQNDQAHGITAHFIKSDWEYTINAFAGNLYQNSELRQMGASMMFEYDLREAFRVVVSVLHSTNDFVQNQRLGIHSKYGFGHGSALLLETGLIQDDPKSGTATKGYYVYSEAIQKMIRGYHIFVTGQAYKNDMTGSGTDMLRMGAGLLAFPMARFEWRIEVQNTRALANSPQISKDSWSLLGQLHVSL